ncbi:glycosyltransferase family 2 protein [Gillisia limnaea]|uniref:Glycosyl transferase family 2 n=1 Tax=Gillisia limnaea (strain DSM 15749 / LMG 21470 / R-8282) TaxID=865937 RepID=H2BYX0_GILLR|nr:glycosyltransferase family 2 protein [Gillisia limnaea]EHQ02272.1 glycosyl transferase family 2 [Gillisia limnaea DSM 15749]
MKLYIVIPAYNEAEFIGKTLQSLVAQTRLPEKIVVVNDQSTDLTKEIILNFAEKYDFISLVNTTSEGEHSPGGKVIRTFNQGYKTLDEDYDIICKFDADLVFPENYLESIINLFEEDTSTGMAGGFCTILKNGNWVLENLTDKDHIRGALKAYRKECFLDIGQLRPAMGWDTADELLAQFHGWKIKTDTELRVNHLKPTGASYNLTSKYKQGEAFYRLRYGFSITLIASVKLAYLKRNFGLFNNYLSGYFKAKKEKQPFLVSEEEGRFIRNLRWQKMRRKIF